MGSNHEALHAAGRAPELYDQVGDREACGRTRGFRAHLHWYGEAAWADACAGIRDLEPAGASRPLALAYVRALVDALDTATREGHHHLAVLLLISLAVVNLQRVRPDAARRPGCWLAAAITNRRTGR